VAIRFYLTASGSQSAAQTSFTDANNAQTSNVAVSPNSANSAPTVTATITESGGSPPNIISAEFFIDTVTANGSGTAMSPSDGLFNSPTENVTKALTSTQFAALSEGSHTVFV